MTEEIPQSLIDEVHKESKASNLNKEQVKEVLIRVKANYKNIKINPGESIGIITAESFGEPSTQMCVDFSEKIIIKMKNKIKIIEIGKFVDSLMELKGSFKINDSEILPLNDLEIYAPSLDQDEKIQWKRVVECSRHNTNKKLMKITTASGRKITCTDAHSFVTRINNKVIPTKGTDLKIGYRIPVINNLFNENLLSEIKINENVLDDELTVKDDLLYKEGRRTKPIKNSIPLDWSTGWFIGAYLAEGHANTGCVGISNINNNYINRVKEFATDIGLNYIDRNDKGKYGPSRTIVMNSSLLSKFIITLCSQGSAYKIVPDFAYNASDEFVSGLLRGYFDGDGNFHVDRKMIRVSSNSKELIDGIALLLSRFKIFSYKTKDKKGQYWLLIPYKYAPLFLTYIGSDIEHKRFALEQLAEKAKNFWNDKSQDYTDMISGFGDLFYRTAKKLGYRTRYVNNFTKRQKIGRTALFRYIKLFENLAKEKNIDVKEEINIMKRMFYSDVIWDEIVEINYIDYNHDYVYDLSVPGLETFTTFEGIITHNTLNIFHFAGVAELNITLGLPRLIEIFDARENASTPAMEVYLKKPYNKDDKKTKKIASLIKETKLKDIALEFSINVIKLQIEVSLNKKNIKDLGITDSLLLEALSKSLKNATVKQLKSSDIIIKPNTKETDLREIYKLKEKAKEAHIKGIEGITHVLPIKNNNNEFVILTSGSNLAKVMEINEVDETRTTTNNLFEVAGALGVEAARETIINESLKVIKEQGLDIDMRHIMLIADLMTTTGKIKGITRSGITGEKESVLARASFETPIKHIINASLIGELDKLNSVIENVMLNQPIPLGTGLPGLLAKMKENVKENGQTKKSIK